jgi:hypothetical protein
LVSRDWLSSSIISDDTKLWLNVLRV